MENLDSASSSDDTDATTPLGDNDSDSDSSDGEGAAAEDDVYKIARVLAAAVRCMHADHAAMRDPAVRACLAANDCRLPETADDLVRMVYNCAPAAYGDKPGAVAAHAEVAAAAERALTHTQKKGSSVQAIYHMLTTDPTIKKVLQTLGFSVKNFHDIALKLSKRLGKLELDITLKTLTKVVEVLLPFIIKIVFHAILVGSPDMPADALVAPGVRRHARGGRHCQHAARGDQRQVPRRRRAVGRRRRGVGRPVRGRAARGAPAPAGGPRAARGARRARAAAPAPAPPPADGGGATLAAVRATEAVAAE